MKALRLPNDALSAALTHPPHEHFNTPRECPMAGSFVELLGTGRALRAQVTWIALGAEGEPREKLQENPF